MLGCEFVAKAVLGFVVAQAWHECVFAAQVIRNQVKLLIPKKNDDIMLGNAMGLLRMSGVSECSM